MARSQQAAIGACRAMCRSWLAASQQSGNSSSSSTWSERLVLLSCWSLAARAHLQQAGPATSVAAAAAAAASAPAGAALALFQPQRWRGESRTRYWLRQAGLEDTGATQLFVAANVGAYGMQMISPAFTQACVRIGYRVAEGEYWRLMTAAFVHGNLIHVGVNSLALWNVGGAVEQLLGSRAFTAVYLGSALAGNIAGYALGPGYTRAMGSSGALFGLFGAYLTTKWVNRHAVPLSRPELVSVAQTLGINLVLMTLFSGSMDHWAHGGGFAGGVLLTLLLGPRYGRWH